MFIKKVDLGHENINKLLIMFAIPCVISMLINSVYNIVDQIFIGKGVGILGNAATNVIFPLVIIFNAISGLIGNGAAANLSLKLGEGKKEDAGKIIGNAVVVSIIMSVILSIIFYFLLPKLVYVFGCTSSVYSYAIDYGKIIIIGAPFMMIYSSLSQLIRADGSPRYSMILLVTGAVLNIILDPIFIFKFNMGVKGGAIATVIGQVVSFLMAIIYLKRKKESFVLDKGIFRTLGLGLSSFITQMTILVLFIFMNNMMTKFGALTKYGSDIPLSVYGVISKINSLYISTVLGISIGAQPIIGFNYGAGNYKRVKETLCKVLAINCVVGILYNIIFLVFPKQLVSIFISNNDPNYKLFLEFAVFLCRAFLMVMGLNFLEMTSSIVVQSLGNVKKSTMVSFIRQIILFIPIACILSILFNKGINGVLIAGPIADSITFVIAIFVLLSEFKKLSKKEEYVIDLKEENEQNEQNDLSYNGKKIIITIAREYGSGGRYVGKVLSKKLGISFYDKKLISIISEKTGFSKSYVSNNDQKLSSPKYEKNNDDRIFIAEEKIIKNLAKKESCVIVGRCSNYILKNNKNTVHIFLYSDEVNKVKRAVKYYGLKEKDALKQINKINKERSKHYKYYTKEDWYDINNYDLALNVDSLGIEKTAEVIKNYVDNKF